jgi:hypothetical protein
MQPIRDAGLRRWVDLQSPGPREFGYEITYWQNNGRTILFLCFNPETIGSETGGGNALGLKSETIPVTLVFNKKISDVRDERTGKQLPAGTEFHFDWPMNQAIVVSFAGSPPR